MQRVPESERIAIATKASKAAAEKLEGHVDPLVRDHGDAATRTLHVMASAKQRCTNEKNVAYASYGGRGIEFRFPSTRSAAEWVLHNLGARPSAQHSIDRIDNDRHYEPGNLRWATRSEQASNKRMYRRTAAGARIRTLQEQRPDLTYETIRLWIKQGATDDEIIGRSKYARSSI